MPRSQVSLADVQAVLWEKWDPIGVHQVPAAHGEYDAYAPQILALLASGATLKELTLHLLQLEKVNMGLPGHPERCERVARRMLSLLEERFP